MALMGKRGSGLAKETDERIKELPDQDDGMKGLPEIEEHIRQHGETVPGRGNTGPCLTAMAVC